MGHSRRSLAAKLLEEAIALQRLYERQQEFK
jgi:hypothetical protein